MKKKWIALLLACVSLSTAAVAGEPAPTIGVVNMMNCLTESKLGQQEQSSFESLKNQMTSLLEDTEKQLSEISNKLNDTEFMDGISPEGEKELKEKYQALSEDMGRYQSQYYQVLQQANMRVVNNIASKIKEASAKVAEKHKLTCVINQEACFFTAAKLDVTNAIIAEMDKAFELENSKKAAPEATESEAS